MGKRWGALEDGDKVEFNEMASAAKEKYAVEKAAYDEKLRLNPELAPKSPVASSKASRGKKAESDPNKPKMPISTYILFSLDIREKIKSENPEMDNKQIMSESGARWKAITDEEKKPYMERVAAAKAQYAIDLEAYNASDGAAEWLIAHPKAVKAKRATKSKASSSAAGGAKQSKLSFKSADTIDSDDDDF